MNYFRIKITAALLLFTIMVSAQQDPQYTFYRFNMNLINPAFAGTGESAEFTVGLRSQWTGVEGAPESRSAFFSMPTNRNLGIGVSVLNDQTFIENQTWLAVDFSYKLKLSRELDLYLGLKAGGSSYNVNTNGLITYGISQDGSLMDFDNRFSPNFGIGAYLRHRDYFFSLSAPKILTPERLKEENGNAFRSLDKRHLYFSGGYTFWLNRELSLETSSMFRYVEASPISVEMTAIFDFGSTFKIGTSYRVDAAISGLVLMDITPGFRIGYAYEAALQNQLSAIDNSSHELFMSMNL